MPQFAHLPLLLKPSGNGKLSKRDGDKMGFPVFPLEWKAPQGEISRGYREDGYLPDAFVNLLALLGWNSGTDQELFSMDELIAKFSLERVNKSGARFDPEKAKWFNHQYLIKKDDKVLAQEFAKIIEANGASADIAKVEKIVGLVKERVSFTHELWEQASFFFLAPSQYDPAPVKKFWKEDTPNIMRELVDVLQNVEPFVTAEIEPAIKNFINEKGYGMGKVMNALRLSLVGESKGPGVADICELLGCDETIRRINSAVEVLG